MFLGAGGLRREAVRIVAMLTALPFGFLRYAQCCTQEALAIFIG